jgi:nucleotide-binding universal stress UspA family protein
MIKTILVPTSGSDADQCVFETALGIAKPFGAHLEFLHVHVSDGEAVVRTPHADFVRGAAMAYVLEAVNKQSASLSANALQHVQEFCRDRHIELRTVPQAIGSVTAEWRETDEPAVHLTSHARHCDLTVVGRRRHRDFLPSGVLERVLLGSGRPIVIAPESAPREVIETIVVGWKETPEAARALSAALPLLKQARGIHIVSIEESGSLGSAALRELASRLEWHGVTTHVELIKGHSSASHELVNVVTRLNADLLVIGAFGRGPLREAVFGGVTQTLIERADFPVFMLH